MKKLFLALFLSFFLLLSNSSFALAAGYYNPYQDGSGNWHSANYGDAHIGSLPNQNSTNVTLMFNNDDWVNLHYATGNLKQDNIPDEKPTQFGFRRTIVPGACYVLGRSAVWDSVDGDKWWQQKEPEKSGWNDKDYAAQAGGKTCGFINNHIDGSGSDHAADFVRANDVGEVWFYNLCENMEGVRTDCNEKFALGKTLTHTLFQVICSYHKEKDADGNPKGDAIADPMCDINKADTFNEEVLGKKILSPPTLAVYGDDGSGDDQKISRLGYKKVIESKYTSPQINNGSFTIVSDLTHGLDFNPESKKVKTELGDLPRDPAELATAGIRIGIGVGGGIAFLLMVFGSFKLIFAGGNPEAVQSGREVITAAIIGLLVVVFAAFILQLIGISIFGFI